MRDDQTGWPRSVERAPNARATSLDDRVLTLLDNALSELLTSGLVAIEVGIAKQRIAEWRRDARRYEILASLARDEYEALLNRSVGQGVSIHALVDAIALQGVDDGRIEFLKRQGYWDDLVGQADADE